MNAQKFTKKALEAVTSAQNITIENQNMQIMPEHLVYALIDQEGGLIPQLLKKSGYYVFTIRDVMSRIRGGHNFSIIRFGNAPINSHSAKLNGIIALDEDTVELHKEELAEDGIILCDTKLKTVHKKALLFSRATTNINKGERCI